MLLHATLGEVVHACKYVFLGPEGNKSTHMPVQEASQLLGENAHFRLGVGLVAQRIYTISR